MQIGVGLDATLNLSWDDQATLAREAAAQGYTSIWTPEGTGHDSYQLCLRRWEASCDVVDGGVTTGISVSPVMYRTPMGFAMTGGTVSDISGGKFIMGIGSGGSYRPRQRQALGSAELIDAGADARLPLHDSPSCGWRARGLRGRRGYAARRESRHRSAAEGRLCT